MSIKLTFLFVCIVICVYGDTLSPTNAPTTYLSNACGVAYISPFTLALIDLETGNFIAERKIDYVSDHIAVDKNTNNVYVINTANGLLYKYDISLKTETVVGSTGNPTLPLGISPFALDFNENDGKLYAINNPFEGGGTWEIDPTDASSTEIGFNDASLVTAFLINKDGQNYFMADAGLGVLLQNNLGNPSIGSTMTLPWSPPPGQFTAPETLDYLNDDPNDNNLVMCWGFNDGFSPLDCYIYNLDTQQYIPFIMNTNLEIRGFEVLPNTMCESLTAEPTLVPTKTPSQTPSFSGCPCFRDLDNTLDYCVSGCCGIGSLVKTIIDGAIYEYGIRDDDKACFTRINGIESIEYTPLTDDQYYTCDEELVLISNDVNCTISDTSYQSIYGALKIFVTNLNDPDISTTLIILYIIFILMMLAVLIFFIYQCLYKINKTILYFLNKNTIKYKQISNALPIDVATDTTFIDNDDV